MRESMGRNKARIIGAALLASAMVFTCAVPAAASGSAAYTPVSGGTVGFEKYLTMDEEANVPNYTFNFTIAAGEAQDATATAPAVYAGNDADKVKGTPTIGTAAFTAGQETYTEVQAYPTDLGIKVEEGREDGVEGADLLGEGEKYARSTVSVDFSGVTFNEPGIYRYVITESDATNPAVTNDSDATRVMDVYVVHTDDGLSVSAYVLHDSEAADPVDSDEETKTDGYINEYTTVDVELKKTVSGNQASRDEYFKFTVVITGTAGNVIDVDLTGADATTGTNGVNTESHTNAAQLTIGEDGTVTAEYWLQANQYVKFLGIEKDAAYAFNEDAAAMADEGYTVTAAAEGDTKTGDALKDDGTREEGTAIALSASDLKMADTALTADTTVTFNNDRTGIIPTGVMVTVLPGIAILLLGAAGIVLMLRKKDRA